MSILLSFTMLNELDYKGHEDQEELKVMYDKRSYLAFCETTLPQYNPKAQ